MNKKHTETFLNDFAKPEKKSDTKRPKSRLSLFSSFRPYVARHLWLILLASLSLLSAAFVTLALPVFIRKMLDHGFSDSSYGSINFYFGILFILGLLLALASASRYYCVTALGERIVADLRRDVFAHIANLSPDFFDRSHSGRIVSRLLTDTTQIKLVLGSTTSVALRHLIVVIGAVVMMIITDAKLSLLVLLSIPCIIVPLIIFGRKIRKRTRAAQDCLANANALAVEQINAIRTVQTFTAEKLISAHFSDLIKNTFQMAHASITLRSLFTCFAIFLVFSSVVIVLWIGSHDVLNGTISGGTLGQFFLYAIFGASTFAQLSEVSAELVQAAGAAERLAELLQEKPSVRTAKNPLPLAHPVQGEIVFDNVDFTYPSRPEEQVLRKLSFSIKVGETIAFVGASGAGKSTIFSLILRFYDPTRGRILFDGTDMKNLSLHDLRSSISYVPQNVDIFDGTLRDNIAFGMSNISHEKIISAAKTANVFEFINTLPDGFDTRVGEKGVMLSGGQKQRIGIARAILKDAPLLLLDEATSALDAHNERLVQDAFKKLMKGRTILVIAHHLSTVLKADRIFVIEKGQLIEEGTHVELIAQRGLYAHLAKLQFLPKQAS